MTELAPGGNESGNHTTRPHHRYTYQKGTKMRKLGILIATLAVTALTVVGFAASPAQADMHEEQLCGNLPDRSSAEGAPIDPDGHGEPVASTFEGLKESCVQSNFDDGLRPSPLLCGIAKGLDVRPGPELEPVTGDPNIGTATVGAVNDDLAENIGDADPLPVVFEPCGPDTTPTGGGGETPPGGGGGGEVAPQVLANNATGDGGMPRTGGELFAGAGFALASVGALIRRFVG